MKNYTVKKLTRQYNGYDVFKYVIQPTARTEITARQCLVEWREWAWSAWGPSRELLWSITANPAAAWSWDTEHGHRRLYLKSDAELILFELRF